MKNGGVKINIKRIIPCLDVKDGRVVKGVKFQNLNDVSSPVELAMLYCEGGADELVFYDITASADGRKIFIDLLKQVIDCISVPLTVGGGISTLDDFDIILGCGADKISINTGALRNPELIGDAARKYGSQCVVLSADVKLVDGAGAYHVFTNGGMADTGLGAIEWFKRGVGLGAGELVVNSIDTDGVKGGFDLPLLKSVCEAVSVPVIASGGAGSIDDFVDLFKSVPKIDAGLAASVFHYGEVKIPELKKALRDNGIEVNPI